ncbi:sugar ABC transporter ATP-binding protein [Conexibacter sp. CPCC 206217]|uniref:sugar ABC transporter ATP-binding protein n=1 Tax=Conexibacter sp. CPCC 206217 TaxID=3064574 RepID=UPI0027273B7E|nr:sugar ABC transporter ATP-binding protein [Conexibacter sp. CPCC 206217]MDO8213556.1 sugar ABC transporter ATP-binding protein [Conexibacter sp. CPCC 206217]
MSDSLQQRDGDRPGADVASAPAPVVEVRGLSKSFPGVRALHDVDVAFHGGRVHALVGENGAGKSTLIKLLAGAYLPDAGEILIDGEHAAIRNPRDSAHARLAFIHQDPQVIPSLSVAEVITLGLGYRRRLRGIVDWRAMHATAREVAAEVGLDVDLRRDVAELSIAEQCLATIARGLLADARLMVFDEPTASFTDTEIQNLYEVIRRVTSQGVAVVYVSHRLNEIFEIADHVTVLKDGERVASKPIGAFAGRQALVEAIVGRSLAVYEVKEHTPGERVVLKLDGVSWRDAVKDVSFELHAGELVGLTGLVGAGRSELAHVIFADHRADAGTIEVDGRAMRLRGPSDAIASGIGLLPEDRRALSGVMTMSVRENLTLPSLRRYLLNPLLRVVRRGSERKRTRELLEQLDVRPPDPERELSTLSGGNQQKVLLAKWLNANARLLILDEPTQGVDVGAKQDIYKLIEQLAEQGKGLLVISSEIEEVITLCKRVLVMREGELVADLDHPDEHRILSACYGVAATEPVS